MVSINKASSVPKKFSSFISALEDTNTDISTALYYLLGAGVLNTPSISPSSFNFVANYDAGTSQYSLIGSYTGAQPLVLNFSGQNSNAILGRLVSGSVYSYTSSYDEVQLTSGDIANTINLPLSSLAPTNISQYSSKYYSTLYVNGTPQLSTNVNLTADTQLRLSFNKISGSTVFPAPIDINKNFSSTPLLGATLSGGGSTWSSNFIYTDTDGTQYLVLHFDNINLSVTPRVLMAELTNTGTTSYLVIPKDVADLNTNMFYTVDENDSTLMYIKLTNTTLGGLFSSAPSTSLKIYFVSPVEELNPFSQNTSFSKKYQLPYKNLAPNADGYLKIFSIDTSTNTVTDITALNSSIVGNIYSLDYTNGVLELFNLFSGALTATAKIYVSNVVYQPSLQLDKLGDVANTITMYGNKGTVYIKNGVTLISNLPTSLNVYAYLQGNQKNFSTILDSNSYLRTVYQIEKAETQIIITETNYGTNNYFAYAGTAAVKLGTLAIVGSSPASALYNFTPDPGLTTPYTQLTTLAQSINIAGQYKTYVLNINETFVPNPGGNIFRFAYIPQQFHTLKLLGVIGDISSINTVTSVTSNFSASILWGDEQTSTTTNLLNITANSGSTKYFEFVTSDITTANPTALATATLPIDGHPKYVALKLTDLSASPNIAVTVNLNFYITLI